MEHKKKAYIFDIDNTLADTNHLHTVCDKDMLRHLSLSAKPFEDVREILNNLRQLGYVIIFITARNELDRDVTEKWLTKNGINFDKLHMRPKDDCGRDEIIKEEIFKNYVKDLCETKGVFEDNPYCVTMWRRLGLTCFQVR